MSTPRTCGSYQHHSKNAAWAPAAAAHGPAPSRQAGVEQVRPAGAGGKAEAEYKKLCLIIRFEQKRGQNCTTKTLGTNIRLLIP